MSFDLAVWRATDGRRVTAAEASRFYSELCSRPIQSFIPGPAMVMFIDSVVQRFRAEQDTSDLPWAAPPDIGEDCVIMPIRSSRAADLLPVIRDLAGGQGLVCFDPQASIVYQSTADGVVGNSPTLELADGRIIADPDPDLVRNSVRSLSAENWFVILERRQNFYLQAGYGHCAGAPPGHYVMEYRAGGPDKHWRTVLSVSDDFPDAFSEYLRGETEWIGRFSWSPLSAD